MGPKLGPKTCGGRRGNGPVQREEKNHKEEIKGNPKQETENGAPGAIESHAKNITEAEPEESMKKNDRKLASEQQKKPQSILKESDKTPERKCRVVQRPKRNAAIRARDRMINMR